MLPIYAIGLPLGTIVGPMIGGTFSNAADKFRIFDVPLLRQYPYAAPCLISAMVYAVGAALTYFLLEEVWHFPPVPRFTR